MGTRLAVPSVSERQYFLFYWVDYWKDLQAGPWPLLRLHQKSPVMRRIRPNDIVWAFTRRPDKRYAIVARYIVSRVGEEGKDDPDARVGRQYFESDRAQYLGIDPCLQKPAEDVIPLVTTAKAAVLGNSFVGPSGVRAIGADGSARLERHVTPPDLPLNDRN